MAYHYLLWATGEDQPGIVSAVSRVLFQKKCNLEDSSMMRLGSEFGILLIFSSPAKISAGDAKKTFASIEKKFALTVGLKPLTEKQARYRASTENMYLVTVYGADRAGLVFNVTACLAAHGFNITDLSTHRTGRGRQAGYVLFIEGELSRRPAALERALRALGQKTGTTIHLKFLPVDAM